MGKRVQLNAISILNRHFGCNDLAEHLGCFWTETSLVHLDFPLLYRFLAVLDKAQLLLLVCARDLQVPALGRE